MREDSYYWGNDPYWVNALSTYEDLRRSGDRVTLDPTTIESFIASDPIAYKLMEAMISVEREEGWEGHKGAPRLIRALLAKLMEIESDHAKGRGS